MNIDRDKLKAGLMLNDDIISKDVFVRITDVCQQTYIVDYCKEMLYLLRMIDNNLKEFFNAINSRSGLFFNCELNYDDLNQLIKVFEDEIKDNMEIKKELEKFDIEITGIEADIRGHGLCFNYTRVSPFLFFPVKAACLFSMLLSHFSTFYKLIVKNYDDFYLEGPSLDTIEKTYTAIQGALGRKIVDLYQVSLSIL